MHQQIEQGFIALRMPYLNRAQCFVGLPAAFGRRQQERPGRSSRGGKCKVASLHAMKATHTAGSKNQRKGSGCGADSVLPSVDNCDYFISGGAGGGGA